MSVLVLNASYEPHQTVPVKKAMLMLIRQVAVVEDVHPELLFGGRPVPRVVRLVRYVTMAFRYTKLASYSRENVLRRDRYRCGYCTGPATTIDHIQPRSRGGRTDWFNTVAACGPCNARKANRTPPEARMRLRVEPYRPTLAQLAPPAGR